MMTQLFFFFFFKAETNGASLRTNLNKETHDLSLS
jgi:hypothetical protein